jgi:hypothetical protein
MAITKTKFINFGRCSRYVALENIKKEKLDSAVTLEDYKEEERNSFIEEILSSMFDEEGNDLIEEVDEQLEVMLPYYNQIEVEAAKVAKNVFKGVFKYSKSTYEQESFDTIINGIRYLCYVDILNEESNNMNIIEVKATTSRNFLELGPTIDGVKEPIFVKDKDSIYRLSEYIKGLDMIIDKDSYSKQKAKLYNRYTNVGHYVYDLAVQRYIIEKDLKDNNNLKNTRYYLAVLNSDYIYDGYQEDGICVYNKDASGNDIITFIDLTEVTNDLMDIVDIDRKKIEDYIKELNPEPYPLGFYCEHKKTTKCKYVKTCWNHIPSKNSILNYIDSHHGFKDESGNHFDRFDLINDGKVKMEDIPVNYLNRYKNVIQRKAVTDNYLYIDNEKIKAGLSQIKYPIYHLDFETFPCPLPRYKGEKCYSQSVFQFSLHIEKDKNICDKETDHFEFLATSHADNREALVKYLCELIDVNKPGTVLVYNESFEKTRLKELGEIFLDYKTNLSKISDMIFDLLYVVKTKSSLYEELGFDKERAKMFNYYHKNMSGSFSIKKILPLFSNLNYDELEVANGVNAIVTYAKFPKMDAVEFNLKYEALKEYCKQDTWAMVEILHGLSKL